MNHPEMPSLDGFLAIYDIRDDDGWRTANRHRDYWGKTHTRERCKRCGRPLWCVIEVVYGSPAGDEGGGGESYWPDAAR